MEVATPLHFGNIGFLVEWDFQWLLHKVPSKERQEEDNHQLKREVISYDLSIVEKVLENEEQSLLGKRGSLHPEAQMLFQGICYEPHLVVPKKGASFWNH